VRGAKRNERAVIHLRALHFYGLSDRHATYSNRREAGKVRSLVAHLGFPHLDKATKSLS
jgi:hypothetical protein